MKSNLIKWTWAISLLFLFSCATPQGTVTKGLIGEQDIHRWDGTSSKTFTRASSTGGTLTLNDVGYEADALISYGGGTSYTQATIEAALTAIGTVNKVTLLIRPGTWVISSNADWSAYTNVTFKIIPGAVITYTTFTLNIPNISKEVDRYQIFSGTGVVTLGAGTDKVYPEWFGGAGDNATINTTAINQSIATGKNVHLGDGTYLTAGGHSFWPDGATGQQLYGNGPEKTTLKRSSGTAMLFLMTGRNYTKMYDLTLDGASLGGGLLDVRGTAQAFYDMRFENSGGTSYALTIQGCNRVTGQRLYFPDGNYGHIQFGPGGGGSGALMSYLSEVQGGDATTYAVYFNGTDIDDVHLDKFSFDIGATQTGFLGVGPLGSPINIGIDNLHVETLQTSGSLFDIGDGGNTFHMKNFHLFASSATPSTDPMFITGPWFNVNFENGFIVRPNASTGSIFKFTDTNGVSLKNIYDNAATNNHIFLECVSGIGIGPRSLIMENVKKNSTVTGVTNSLKGDQFKITQSNMDFTASGSAGSVIFENVTGDINTANMTNVYLVNASGTVTDAGKLVSPIKGTLTLAANVATTTVTQTGVAANSRIILTPTSANAAADQGSATGVWVTTKNVGASFVLTHPNNANADKTFDYIIINP